MRSRERIVAWGNGWLPFGASPEQVKSGREALNHLATQAGRDPRSIQIMVLGAPADPEVLKAYEQAGADAVACLMLSAPEKEA
jgi:alkanesulfonate monooxygenase SsuD/methylene tetrahydromethanopterin reductase-like flavin-dependent oxidoreductase (luciferase family)